MSISSRRDQIADAAITVIAESGLRGLTHRAVDAVAGAPLGTTSNHARTRLALLTLALARVVELDAAVPSLWPTVPPGATPAASEVFASLAQAIDERVRTTRPRLIARYELALEATRVPELRRAYDREGEEVRSRAAAVLSRLGVRDARVRADVAVAVIDGFLFDSVAGSGARSPGTVEHLTESLHRTLGGLLTP